MFNIFKKKESLSLATTHFELSFNLKGIKNFIEQPSEIKARCSNSFNEDCVKYNITLLPHETSCFYHKEVGEISSFIDGRFVLETSTNYQVIYWGMIDLNFHVWIDTNTSEKALTILSLSSCEISSAIMDRRLKNDPIDPVDLMNGYEISASRDRYPNYLRKMISPTTTYCNELVKLAITPLNSTPHHVFYPDISR